MILLERRRGSLGAYMSADTAPKVGYRPYGAANPADAHHLSGLPDAGLGVYYFNRPFDPWELYPDTQHHDGYGQLSGLGQNHPFKPQAWQLHGLGDASSDVTAQAVQELQASGQITSGEAEAILDGSMTFDDVLGFDPTDQSSWLDLPDKIRSANQQLQSIESQLAQINNDNLAQHRTPTADFAAAAQHTAQIRSQFESAVSSFTNFYRAVTGQVPPGMSGLGIALVIWVAGAAAAIAAVYIAISAINAWHAQIDVDKLKAQSQQTQTTSTASTNQSLLQQLAIAQAKGDTTTAQSILKTLQTTGAQAGQGEQWLMTNAKWIGIGAIALVVAGPLASGLFGGRRR